MKNKILRDFEQELTNDERRKRIDEIAFRVEVVWNLSEILNLR